MSFSEPDRGFRLVVPPARRVTARPRRTRGCSPALVAVVVTAAALVVCLCAVLAVAPALLAARSGGHLNVLVAGIDRRASEGWDTRTDTIIVVTLDPTARTAGVLSIPRDLQLTIPSVGDDRINTANVYGHLYGYPGGGPALLEATIASNFGIPIDRYVMLDFTTFERIVDALGGIDVNVPKALTDTRYPDPRPNDPYAFKTIQFEPGPQHMNGQQALEYARSRMSTSDFDRAGRQQLILLAIRKKALGPAGLLRLPAVALAVIDGVKTDVSPIDALVLSSTALQIGPSHVEQVVLQPPMVYNYQRADGADVELPNWELINPVIQEMFR